MGRIFRGAILIIVWLIFVNPAAVGAANYVDYMPMTLGSHWTYQNVADPSDTYTYSVFEKFLFAGNPAVKIGTDNNNCLIGYNNGTSVNLYGYVNEGVLYSSAKVLTEVTDGTFFNFGEPSNFLLMRKWDNLDAVQKSVYGIDPSLTDLLFEVVYDSKYQSNSHNNIVQSNLGGSFPNYAVTALAWYKPGVGEIVNIDVNASSGVTEKRFDLIDYKIMPVPEPSVLLLLGSSLIGLVGLRRGDNK